METATFVKKKGPISKGKMKRTIKNVLCRPDPVFWPNISEEESKSLEDCLSTYKIEIPEFKKPHWKEIKTLTKEQRPKQPKLKRVDGLLLGITECKRALQSKECSAVIIESSVNPRAIVQPLIEACTSTGVPVLCSNGLKITSSKLFGVPTSCLGVKNNFLQDLVNKVNTIAKQHKPPTIKAVNDSQETMEVDENIPNIENKTSSVHQTSDFSYLLRTNKKTRIFNPSAEVTKTDKAFTGQDFVGVSNKPQHKSDSKAYMNMILKRMGNNQNRVKKK